MQLRDQPRLLGRDDELERLDALLDAATTGLSALVVQGEPGIGKSAVLREGMARGADRSFRVLVARPVESEAGFPFVGLGDLLDPVVEELVPLLPPPQRRALEAALLRVDVEGMGSDAQGVSLAVVHAMRTVASWQPTLVVIDDVQWLDAPSARVLRFALRRLVDEPIGLLMSWRQTNGDQSPLGTDRVIPPERLLQLRLGPLSVEALGRLVRDQLGAGIPGSRMEDIHRASAGNPFLGLELARAMLQAGGAGAPGEPLPVSANLSELLGDRLRALSPDARELLALVAALSQPTVDVIRRVAPAAAQDRPDPLVEAERAGVIELEQEQIRFSHPLLRSVAYAQVPAAVRRSMHRRLAGAGLPTEEAARHLALGADGPDPHAAAALDAAAYRARARGAPDAAGELLELALRLTPSGDADDRRRRSFDAAEFRFEAGDTDRARSLLEEAVSVAPEGPARADALRRLGWLRYHEESYVSAASLFDKALQEARGDPVLTAVIERDLAWAGLMYGDVQEAAAHARKALELAEGIEDPAALAETLTAVALAEAVLGEGIRADVLQRAIELEEQARERLLAQRPSRSTSMVLRLVSEEPGAARQTFERLRDRAVRSGDESSLPLILHHLGEAECRSGEIASAARHVADGLEIAARTHQDPVRAMLLSTLALVEAYRGQVDAARAAATEGRALGEQTGSAVAVVQNTSVLGFLEVSLGNASGAHRVLGPLTDQVTAMRLAEPGVVRFLPDEIEALVALGEMERARSLVSLLETRAAATGQRWARGAALRGRGLLSASEGDLDGALGLLEEALEEQERLDEPMEEARTMLVIARIHRRRKQKAASREWLMRALSVFERLEASLWQERVGAELARLGASIGTPIELTATERKVAELVARGKTNREIAAELFIGVKTVEANLTRAFHKLGVRSRTELAAALVGGTPTAPST